MTFSCRFSPNRWHPLHLIEPCLFEYLYILDYQSITARPQTVLNQVLTLKKKTEPHTFHANELEAGERNQIHRNGTRQTHVKPLISQPAVHFVTHELKRYEQPVCAGVRCLNENCKPFIHNELLAAQQQKPNHIYHQKLRQQFNQS